MPHFEDHTALTDPAVEELLQAEDDLPVDEQLEVREDTAGPQPLTDAELSSHLQAALDDAQDYLESEISPARAEAWAAYKGRPLQGDDELKGRSKVRSRDVYETVHALLPPIMRVFFGSDRAVEYSPVQEEDAEAALQATEYVSRVVLQQDNPGIRVGAAVTKDALLKRVGMAKVWYDPMAGVDEVSEYSGIPAEAWVVLTQDPTVEVIWEAADEQGLVAGQVRRVRTDGQIRIAEVPPEEVLVDRHARGPHDWRMISHRQMVTVSDLVEMGYAWDEIEEHVGTAHSSTSLEYNEERVERRPYDQERDSVASLEPASRSVEYHETYIKVDYDGDGRAELRKICSLGGGRVVLRNSEVDDHPFVFWFADPEPHVFLEASAPGEVVGDIQLIKTAIQRGMLDSLSLSITPRAAILDGGVNIRDAQNVEVGALIREYVSGAYRPIDTPFLGEAALPVLAYYDQARTARTGRSPDQPGLSPDVLQSTTRAGVDAAVDASQEQVVMIARFLAEGWKELYRKVFRLLVRHQQRARTVRLRGKWVAVDPRTWNTQMDVAVNVGLGAGLPSERAAVLGMLAQKQEQILQTMGPDNPIVTVAQYRNTLAKIAELSGIQDTSYYLSPVPADWKPPPPPPPPPDPNLIIAQAEQLKAQTQAQQAQSEAQLEAAKLRMEDDRKRDEMEIEAVVKALEIQAKYGTQLDIAKIRATAQAVNARRKADE